MQFLFEKKKMYEIIFNIFFIHYVKKQISTYLKVFWVWFYHKVRIIEIAISINFDWIYKWNRNQVYKLYRENCQFDFIWLFNWLLLIWFGCFRLWLFWMKFWVVSKPDKINQEIEIADSVDLFVNFIAMVEI